MRKFFGQKSKHKSLNMPLVPLNKNDNDKTIINSETTDSGEKSKKLFVVVSGIVGLA